MKPAITISNVATGYHRHVTTSGINAELRCGEMVCLIGVNGAGKSTLLKTLSGFLPPVSGNIEIMGQQLARLGTRQLARLIAVVLTERPAAINMTVEQLVALGRSPYTSFFGSLRDSDRRTVDKAIDQVDIQSLRNRNIATLSDGERQKALIAKAIAQETPIILLDEPTAFLDFTSKVEILRMLHAIAAEQQKAILLSTHDIELALRLADRLWLIDDKQAALLTGTPRELADSGVVAMQFNSPGATFCPSTLTFGIHP